MNCPPFVCADGSEIPYELRCNVRSDGGGAGGSYLDCADGSDEVNCPVTGHRCANRNVIALEQVCNGSPDCLFGGRPTTGPPDYSDELDCFTCSDGSLISNRNICDGGRRDCADGSDEANCGSVDRHICVDGSEIDPNFECDGELDCVGGDDEIGCGGFSCLFADMATDIIAEGLICNGVWDCDSGNDESNCGSMGSFEP